MTRLLSLFLLAAGPAAALEISPYEPLCAVAQRLGQDMAEHSNFAAPTGCPRIAFTLPAAGEEGAVQVGAYYPATGMIALAQDLDLTTPWGQSVLLHELVHLVQHRDHGIPECQASMEYEAYAIQAAFLKRHGMNRDAAMLYVFGSLVSHCGENDPYNP